MSREKVTHMQTYLFWTLLCGNDDFWRGMFLFLMLTGAWVSEFTHRTKITTDYTQEIWQDGTSPEIFRRFAWQEIRLCGYQSLMKTALNLSLSMSSSSSSFSSEWFPGGSLLFHLVIILGGLDWAKEHVSHYYSCQQQETSYCFSITHTHHFLAQCNCNSSLFIRTVYTWVINVKEPS